MSVRIGLSKQNCPVTQTALKDASGAQGHAGHFFTSFTKFSDNTKLPPYLIKRSKLSSDPRSARSSVTFMKLCLQDMKNAIAKLDDKDLNGRRIRLVEDSQNKKRSSRSRSDSRSRSRSGSRRKSSKRSRSRRSEEPHV